MSSGAQGTVLNAGSEAEKIRSISSDGLTWVDVVDPTAEETAILAREYPFQQMNLENLLSKRQLVKVESYEDYLFMMLHFPVCDNQGNISSAQVSMFVGKNYFVSVHPSSLNIISETFRQCESDEQQRKTLMKS